MRSAERIPHLVFGVGLATAALMNILHVGTDFMRLAVACGFLVLALAYMAAPLAFRLHGKLADTSGRFDQAMKSQARSRTLIQPVTTIFVMLVTIAITPARFSLALSVLHVAATLVYVHLLVARLFHFFERTAMRPPGSTT